VPEKDATEKLASWFGVGKEKAAPRMEARPDSTKQHQKTYPEPSTGSDSVKYMQEFDAWFDALSHFGMEGSPWLRRWRSPSQDGDFFVSLSELDEPVVELPALG
jgi:hypothetical protein